MAAYLTTSDADALAGTLPAKLLSHYLAAGSPDKAAALLQASLDVDTAYPYQGRKYSPVDQEREFPRLAYSDAVGPWLMLPVAGTALITPGGAEVWDWDSVNNAAVVPAEILQAVVWQAESILSGNRDDRLDAIHDQVSDQGVGSLKESYQADAVAKVLCRRADACVQQFVIRVDRMI